MNKVLGMSLNLYERIAKSNDVGVNVVNAVDNYLSVDYEDLKYHNDRKWYNNLIMKLMEYEQEIGKKKMLKLMRDLIRAREKKAYKPILEGMKSKYKEYKEKGFMMGF